MPEELVKKVDQQSRLTGSNRSDFIRQAVRKQVSNLELWQQAAIAARTDYSGPDMNESEVADLVRQERQRAS